MALQPRQISSRPAAPCLPVDEFTGSRCIAFGEIMATPLQILHLISSNRWTGVAEPAANLAQFQIQAGHEVRIGIIGDYTLQDALVARQLPMAQGLDLQRHYNPFGILKAKRALRNYILTNKVKVVHCHLLHDHWLSALAIRGLDKAHRPLLVRTSHRFDKLRTDWWHRWLFESATDLLITVSEEQGQQHREAYPKLAERIRVIYGGVDPEVFRPENDGSGIRTDMGEKPGARIAGIVAHLGYNRGHKWLLKAVPALAQAVPEAIVWIVGQGELRRTLRKESRKPEYDRRVFLAGYRTTDLPETYAAMDCGLLLGLGSEGSARAALETMATGKPVIAVAKGALAETITDGKDGYLLKENDVEGLSRCLIDLLGNPEKCAAMGRAARQTILDRFTGQRRFERTEAAYAEVMGRRG